MSATHSGVGVAATRVAVPLARHRGAPPTTVASRAAHGSAGASRAAPDAIATRRRRERDVTRATRRAASHDARVERRDDARARDDDVARGRRPGARVRGLRAPVARRANDRALFAMREIRRRGDGRRRALRAKDRADVPRRLARHPGRADGTTSRRRTMRGVYLKMCALATAAAARGDDARTGRRARGRRESGSARGSRFERSATTRGRTSTR